MIFDIALGIFLFLSPIIILIGKNARINGEILALQFYQFKTLSNDNNILQFQFFEYGVIALLIIALSGKQVRIFKDRYLALFLGACALSVVLHPKTILSFTPILLGILLYYLVVTYAKNIKLFLWCIAGVSILNTLFAILQFFGAHWIYKATGRIDGLMCLSSHLGAYQALAFPICYVINPFLSIIPLIGLILSKSTTPFIALLIGLIYMWFPKKEKIFCNLAPMGLIAILGIFIVLVIRNYQDTIYKFSLRIGLWGDIFKQIIRNPFGYGLNTFSKVDKMGHWQWTYNEYLSIAYCVGLLGLFFAGMFLMDKFNKGKEGLERYLTTSCLIVLVICLGQSALHFPRLAGTIIPMFAFLEILKRKGITNG